MPKLRNELNQDQCLASVELVSVSALLKSYHPSVRWVHQLATLISHYVDQSINSIKDIETQLKKQLDAAKKYHELETTLKVIYGLLSQEIQNPTIPINTDADNLKLVAERLYEGLFACGPGFQVRVYTLWEGIFYQETLSAWIQIFRNEIVERTSRVLSDYVHTLNDVSKMANKLGFGVQPINSHDFYAADVSSAAITAILEDNFLNQFTPLLIIQSIENILNFSKNIQKEARGVL